MADTKRPSLWRVHLSTVILAMLTIGVLAALNFSHAPQTRARSFHFYLNRSDWLDPLDADEADLYGWPARMAMDDVDNNRFFIGRPMLIDLGVAFGILAVVVLGSEVAIRMRHQKPAIKAGLRIGEDS
jgi:hypothetical protein